MNFRLSRNECSEESAYSYYMGRAKIFRGLSQCDRAIKYYEEAANLYKKGTSTDSNLYEKAPNLEDAYKTCKEANKILCYWEKGQYKKAWALKEKAENEYYTRIS